MKMTIPLSGRNRPLFRAGKTTFYYAHLQWAALRLVNADVIVRKLGIDPYAAATLAVRPYRKK